MIPLFLCSSYVGPCGRQVQPTGLPSSSLIRKPVEWTDSYLTFLTQTWRPLSPVAASQEHVAHACGKSTTISRMASQHAWATSWTGKRPIFFGWVIQHLIGNHACAGTTPSTWSTETACDVNVDHCDGILLMEWILIMHRIIILPNIRSYLIV